MARLAKINEPVVVQFALYAADGFARLPGEVENVVAALRRATPAGGSEDPGLAVTIAELQDAPGEYIAVFTPRLIGDYTLTLRHAASRADLEELVRVDSATLSDLAGHSLVPLNRGTVEVGNVVEFQVRWILPDGTAFEPYEIRRVVVRDADTEAVLFEIGAADIVQLAAGTYRIRTPIAVGDARTLVDRWYYRAFAGDPEQSRAFNVIVREVPADDGLLISIARLRGGKELGGVDLTLDDGTAYPDDWYETAIREATDALQAQLDLDLRPTNYVGDDAEIHDYDHRRYMAFGWFELDHRPMRELVLVRAEYPSLQSHIDFPTDWYVVTQPHSSMFNIVPYQGTLEQYLIANAGGGGTITLPMLRPTGQTWWPGIFKVSYRAGFEAGQLPSRIQHALAMRAAVEILNVAGDLITGAGVATKSVGIGGLSQSIGTTASATNAGYGARIIQLEKHLKELVPAIKRQFHGPRLGV